MLLALNEGALKTKAPLAVRAAERVQRLFRDKGLEVADLMIENGAGMSPTERLSPRSLARLLTHVQPYANTLTASLAVTGADGAIHARLGQSPVAGNAFLRTGSLP